MHCKTCGERMEGDGYTQVYYCPNAKEETYEFNEPDANPVYCEPNEELRNENDNQR